MDDPHGWSVVNDALEREFSFEGYPPAVAFANRVAELAQAEDHHPELTLSYGKVLVRWWTHTAGGVTDRDRELASRTGELA